MIKRLYIAASARARVRTAEANKVFKDVTVLDAAATGNLIFIPLDAAEWSDVEVAGAAELNGLAVREMGYTPADIASLAAMTVDPVARGQIFAVAATSTDSVPDKLAWTAEVAQSVYAAGLYDTAVVNADFVLSALGRSSNVSVATSMTESLATRVKGWALLRSGEIDRYQEILSKHGSSMLSEPLSPTFYAGDGGYPAIDRDHLYLPEAGVPLLKFPFAIDKRS